MNLFWLHLNTRISAEFACDQHIVKMPTEHAQMMQTVMHHLGFETLMKPIGMSKLLLQWVYADYGNFLYLLDLTYRYVAEYRTRYSKNEHGAWRSMQQVIKQAGGLPAIQQAYFQKDRAIFEKYSTIGKNGKPSQLWKFCTLPPLYMNDEYKNEFVITGQHEIDMKSVVSCYQKFYRNEKIAFARYRYTNSPFFMKGAK